MYFDLNVPIPLVRRQKELVFLASQLEQVESRIDLLVHCPYLARRVNLSSFLTRSSRIYRYWIFTDCTEAGGKDTCQWPWCLTACTPETRWNSVSEKIEHHPRPGQRKRVWIGTMIGYCRSLFTCLLQINASTPLFDTYDIIALIPTTHATFSLACLTHSQPSPLTAHIIALPLTLPRLPFHMKHTLVRTAIKNGSVFEINYVGALGGEHDSETMQAGVAESGASAKRNWWAASRELVRVSKGKGLLLSGGVASSGDLRAPRDIGNLYGSFLWYYTDYEYCFQGDYAWVAPRRSSCDVNN